MREQRSTAPSSPGRGQMWGRWLLLVVLIGLGFGILWLGPQLWPLLQDEQALEAWVDSLGWWGPIVLVTINAAQIVIAPIPGYVLQIAAGFLYGPVWGGVWGSLGLLLGSSLAFGLARLYGRPVAEQLVGASRLTRWEQVTRSENTLAWFVLLTAPTGDLPYFLAGLSRVSYIKILAITLVIRVPSTFVVAAAGAGVMLLTWWQLTLIFIGLTLLLVLFLRYQTQLLGWIDRQVTRLDAPHEPDTGPVEAKESASKAGTQPS